VSNPITTYIRAGVLLTSLAVAGWSGWTIRAWLDDSRELKKVEQERDAAIDRERAAEAKAKAAETKRAEIAGELETEKANIHDQVQTVIKRIPVYIGGSDCALDVDGVRDLNAARGAVVPDARRLVDGRAVTRRSDSP
jgi:hypothetical protein